MQSMKVANTGRVIGTITQDRLSAVSGVLGEGPAMTDVEVIVSSAGGPSKTLNFSVARQEQLTPVLVATGVSQAILGSNDAGLSNGFILRSDVTFPAKATVATRTLYAGPQGFQQGLNQFVQDLAQNLQNPYEKSFPGRVVFTVEALEQNPAITLDLFQLSRSVAGVGDTLQATLSWRDFQGESRRQVVDIPIDPSWVGRNLGGDSRARAGVGRIIRSPSRDSLRPNCAASMRTSRLCGIRGAFRRTLPRGGGKDASPDGSEQRNHGRSLIHRTHRAGGGRSTLQAVLTHSFLFGRAICSTASFRQPLFAVR